MNFVRSTNFIQLQPSLSAGFRNKAYHHYEINKAIEEPSTHVKSCQTPHHHQLFESPDLGIMSRRRGLRHARFQLSQLGQLGGCHPGLGQQLAGSEHREEAGKVTWSQRAERRDMLGEQSRSEQVTETKEAQIRTLKKKSHKDFVDVSSSLHIGLL